MGEYWELHKISKLPRKPSAELGLPTGPQAAAPALPAEECPSRSGTGSLEHGGLRAPEVASLTMARF